MNNVERAKQFMPFDALKGLQEELRRREKKVTEVIKIELSDEKLEELALTFAKLQREDTVDVTFFYRGHYYNLQGTVSKISTDGKFIVIGEERIFFDDVYDIKIL